MPLLLPFLTLLALLASSSNEESAAAVECLNGIRPALLTGGFSGATDCDHDRLSVQHVGRVQRFGRVFEIYSYRYRLKSVCPDCARHDGQRVIFMELGRYVGQYKPDSVRVTVSHGGLVLVPTVPAYGKPVVVGFTRAGPAKHLLVGGDVIDLFR